MKTLWQWLKNKFGRVCTSVGGVLMSLEVFDANPLKPWLTSVFSDKTATHIISGVAAFFFVLSYVRHQVVASKHPAPVVIPPPQP